MTNESRVELKVCEVCGTLWLRAAGQGVYCRGCTVALREFPAARMSRRRRSSTVVTRTVVCAGGAR